MTLSGQSHLKSSVIFDVLFQDASRVNGRRTTGSAAANPGTIEGAWPGSGPGDVRDLDWGYPIVSRSATMASGGPFSCMDLLLSPTDARTDARGL